MATYAALLRRLNKLEANAPNPFTGIYINFLDAPSFDPDVWEEVVSFEDGSRIMRNKETGELEGTLPNQENPPGADLTYL